MTLRRALAATLALAALLVALLAASAAAASLTGPLNGLTTTTTTAPTQSVTTATTTTASGSGGGLTTLELIGIAVVTLGVFGTIFYTIRSDARRHAPRGGPALGIDRERGTVTPRADRVKRSRAQAKAARRARRAGR
jgi:hypothetical protein